MGSPDRGRASLQCPLCASQSALLGRNGLVLGSAACIYCPRWLFKGPISRVSEINGTDVWNERSNLPMSPGEFHRKRTCRS